jgi:DNA-binding CsgD family transcriptional regulator
MRRCIDLNGELLAAIGELRAAGLSIELVAERIGVDKRVARRGVVELGLPIQRRGRVSIWSEDSARVERLLALAREGLSRAEIGRRLGITKGAAHGKLRRLQRAAE